MKEMMTETRKFAVHVIEGVIGKLPSIPWAKLNLEVDGEYHRTNPEQWFCDLKRDLYSHNEGKSTIHIPNHYVDTHLDELANVIAEVIRKKK